MHAQIKNIQIVLLDSQNTSGQKKVKTIVLSKY